MLLYHVTSATVAVDIMAAGFVDGTGTYMTTTEHSGVWVSDQPLTVNEGAFGDTLLRIEVPDAVVVDVEWREDGKPYREFLVPAAVLNAYPAAVVDGVGLGWDQGHI